MGGEQGDGRELRQNDNASERKQQKAEDSNKHNHFRNL